MGDKHIHRMEKQSVVKDLIGICIHSHTTREQGTGNTRGPRESKLSFEANTSNHRQAIV